MIEINPKTNSKNKDIRKFKCDICGRIVRKRRDHGLIQKTCGFKCASKLKRRLHPEVMCGGYLHIYYPTHPFATKQGYIPRHRRIIEENIGRYLSKEEIVHHIDENPFNNSLKNLKIVSFSEHSSIHAQTHKCKKTGRFV